MPSKRLVFVYVGKNGNGVSYRLPTTTQLNAFSKATEIVISTGNYSGYTTSAAERTALAAEIANLTFTIKNQIGKKVWIPTPAFTKFTSVSDAGTKANMVTSFINEVKTAINNRFNNAAAFTTNVIGVYVNKEHITNPYQDANAIYNLDPSSLANMKKHPDVAFFSNVRSVASTQSLKTLWCPYFGSGPDALRTINDIGYVTNLHTIFDFVFLQPHYYFLQSKEIFKNFGAIRKSMQAQRVYDRDLIPIGTQKGSTTEIGVQMELDKYWHSGVRPAGATNDRATAADLQYRYSLYQKCYNNQSITAKAGDDLTGHGALGTLTGYSKTSANISFYIDAKYTSSDETWYSAVANAVNSYFL